MPGEDIYRLDATSGDATNSEKDIPPGEHEQDEAYRQFLETFSSLEAAVDEASKGGLEEETMAAQARITELLNRNPEHAARYAKELKISI